LTGAAVKSIGQYYQQLIFGPNAILCASIIYSALRSWLRKLWRNCRFVIKKVYKSANL